MSDTQPTRHFRAAQTLNVIINIIICALGLLLACVIVIALLSQFNPDSVDMIQDKVATDPTAFLLTVILIFSAYLYVAFLVRAIVKTTIDGNPFVNANISRLRRIWMTIIGAEILRIIIILIFVKRDGLGVETWFQTWFLALFIAIMAEVFRIGLELKRDQELTV